MIAPLLCLWDGAIYVSSCITLGIGFRYGVGGTLCQIKDTILFTGLVNTLRFSDCNTGIGYIVCFHMRLTRRFVLNTG